MNKKQKITAAVASGVAVVGIAGGVAATQHHADPNAKVCADYATMQHDLNGNNTPGAVTAYHQLQADYPSATNTAIKNGASAFLTFFSQDNASQASSASYILGGACSSAGYQS